MNFVVPPGGFAGFSQMTPASKRALAPHMSRIVGSPKRRKSRRKKSASSSSSRKRSTRSRGKRKLKFGSPAWRKKYLGK
jgi:hypothetical protein